MRDKIYTDVLEFLGYNVGSKKCANLLVAADLPALSAYNIKYIAEEPDHNTKVQVYNLKSIFYNHLLLGWLTDTTFSNKAWGIHLVDGYWEPIPFKVYSDKHAVQLYHVDGMFTIEPTYVAPAVNDILYYYCMHTLYKRLRDNYDRVVMKLTHDYPDNLKEVNDCCTDLSTKLRLAENVFEDIFLKSNFVSKYKEKTGKSSVYVEDLEEVFAELF